MNRARCEDRQTDGQSRPLWGYAIKRGQALRQRREEKKNPHFTAGTICRLDPGDPFVFIFLMGYSMHNDSSGRMRRLLLRIALNNAAAPRITSQMDGIFQKPTDLTMKFFLRRVTLPGLWWSASAVDTELSKQRKRE